MSCRILLVDQSVNIPLVVFSVLPYKKSGKVVNRYEELYIYIPKVCYLNLFKGSWGSLIYALVKFGKTLQLLKCHIIPSETRI